VFHDRVRQRTKRRMFLNTKELIAVLHQLLRGWGEYFKRSHVGTLFHRLDGWIEGVLPRARVCQLRQIPSLAFRND
jgi:hypothetical protein